MARCKLVRGAGGERAGGGARSGNAQEQSLVRECPVPVPQVVHVLFLGMAVASSSVVQSSRRPLRPSSGQSLGNSGGRTKGGRPPTTQRGSLAALLCLCGCWLLAAPAARCFWPMAQRARVQEVATASMRRLRTYRCVLWYIRLRTDGAVVVARASGRSDGGRGGTVLQSCGASGHRSTAVVHASPLLPLPPVRLGVQLRVPLASSSRWPLFLLTPSTRGRVGRAMSRSDHSLTHPGHAQRAPNATFAVTHAAQRHSQRATATMKQELLESTGTGARGKLTSAS